VDNDRLIKINVSVVDKSYALTIKESEEEIVRKAASMVKERIGNLSKQYQAGNQKDFLSMGILLLAVDYLKLSSQKSQVEDTGQLLDQMDERLTNFFDGH